VRRCLNYIGLAMLTAFLVPAVVVAAQSPKGAAPGRLIDAPDGQSRMEQLSIEPGLAPALLAVPLESSLRIEDWPVAPGSRRTVVVTRHDVYAADAKIVAIDGGKEVEIPRSKLVFLWGTAEGDGATAVLITVDPETAAVSGSSMTTDGSFDLMAPSAERAGQLLARDGALRKADAEGQGFQCGFGDLPKDPARAALRAARLATSVPQVLSSMHSAVIAVDTDNEFMGTKFSNSTTNATNYIAQVFAGVTAIYERDLFVRLLQGYTVLRLSTTPDPYVQNAGGNADGPKLDEVSAFWNTNYTGVKRALVVMLSGKQPASGGWSGIAWIGGLCDPYTGVSFSQVFRTGLTAGSGDFQLVGHEMGHNFGSEHTHCTDTSATAGIQPIDFCYSAECGASWNPASGQVCPANFTISPANGAPINNVRGTLMSYCHLLAGCAVTNVFHPLSISLEVGPDIDAAVNQCIFTIGNPAPTFTSISPISGTASGGTAVTITGTNFRSPASVVFADLGGGKAATGVVVVNPTTITATTPAHTAGLTDVAVMNPDQQTGTLRNAYTYLGGPPPVTATGISPNGGTTAGGTAVTITGTNFVAPATVTMGGTAATAVVVASANMITATAPAHAAGIVDVVVQSNAQTATLASGYFYIAPVPPGRFYTLSPCRLVDTRNPTGGLGLGGPALVASTRRNFTLTGVCGIPTTAKAISVNLTVTGAAAPGFLSLFPGNGIVPATSNINFSIGQTRANNAVVLLATDGNGSLAVLNGAVGTTHFILDVNGYFQ
jgi:branched-subunit amino acid transport protein